jgi:hypothetical protein
MIPFELVWPVKNPWIQGVSLMIVWDLFSSDLNPIMTVPPTKQKKEKVLMDCSSRGIGWWRSYPSRE